METTITSASKTERLNLIGLRLLIGLVSVGLTVIGIFKIIGTEPHLVHDFTQMHLREYLPLIGSIEILIAVGLLLKATRVYTAAFALVFLSAAVAAHLTAGQPLAAALPAIVTFMMTMCILKFDGRLKIVN